MKRLFALLLAGCLTLLLPACGGQETPDPSDQPEEVVYPACFDGMESLIAAAQAEGELTVYGSCEESYLTAACDRFQELFGIRTTYQRSSDGADVWFGGASEDCWAAAEAGLLMAYSAANASHLTDASCRDEEGYWYGIRRSLLGFIVDSDMLRRMEIDAPADWADLLELPYQDLIWTSNYASGGAGRLLLRTAMQLPEAFGGQEYLMALDENTALYTASDADMLRCIGTGECVIGIGFLHDGMARILDDNCTNVRLIAPAGGSPAEVDAAAIFKDAARPNAARLWIEYALSPECIDLAAQNGCYQYPVIDNAASLSLPSVSGLNSSAILLPKDDGSQTDVWVEELMTALTDAGADTGADRFLTD